MCDKSFQPCNRLDALDFRAVAAEATLPVRGQLEPNWSLTGG